MVHIPPIPPKILYRYYKEVIYATQLLDKKELYFSRPRDFNDPYDFSLSLEGLDDHVRYLLSLNGYSEPTLNDAKGLSDRQKNKLIKQFKENFRVCSFTENYDSFQMWSYYANGFKGCCIGFNAIEMINPSNHHNFIMKVDYVNKRPKFSDMTGIDSTEKLQKLAAYKNEEYKNEKEWRAIRYLKNSNPGLHCPKNGIVRIPAIYIKEVIVGHKIPKKYFKTIQKLAKRDNIELYQIGIHSSSDRFELQKNRIQLHGNLTK